MYLIGLTGNIASGKSTVRQMLEQLGARGIDADQLAHAVLLRDKPVWRAVVDAFGRDILESNGEVDRQKLGAIVFADPAKLRELESLTHPAITTELALLLREAQEPFVVVEAIKLIEAGLYRYCDAVWVVTAPREEAKRRLMQERGLSAAAAEVRLNAQPPLEEKLKHATTVIDNGGSFQETRSQVLAAFATLQPLRATDKATVITAMLGASPPPAAQLAQAAQVERQDRSRLAVGAATGQLKLDVRRSGPGDVELLAEALSRAEGTPTPISRTEMLHRFGRWGYFMAEAEGEALALVAWRVENLVALIRDIWAKSPELAPLVLPPLFRAIEQESESLQCEAAILMIHPESQPGRLEVIIGSGYAVSKLEELPKLWRDIAQTELRAGEEIYVKRLL